MRRRTDLDGVQAPKRTLLLEPGVRLPLLLDATGVPHLWTTLYLLDDCAPYRTPYTTLCNRMQGVGALLTYFRLQGIEDVASHVRPRLPNRVELEALARHLGGVAAGELTSAPANFDEAVRFLAWLARKVQAASPEVFKARLQDFGIDARHCRPRGGIPTERTRLGLTHDQRTVFEGVIVPEAPGNPFLGKVVFRNYVICRVSFELGLRAGELLGLKVEDVVIRREAWLRVVQRRNDPEDPRGRPASAKTVGRDLLLSDDLADLLERLLDERDMFPASADHPYVFVAASGAPLSDRGLRKMFATLRRESPELAGLVNHVLRHDRADRHNEMVEAKGIDREHAIRELELLMGWVMGSAMTAHYGKRSRTEIANRRSLDGQRRLFPRHPPDRRRTRP